MSAPTSSARFVMTKNVITALYKVWFPLEYGYDPELMHAASCLGLWDAIRAGTTTVANDQYFPDATARAAARLGARALVACAINEFSREEPITYDAATRRFTIVYDRAKAERLLSENVELIEKWKGHELVRPFSGRTPPDLLSTEMLVRCAELAEEHDVKMLIHVAQSEAEVACVGSEASGARSRCSARSAFCLLACRPRTWSG